MIFKAFIREPLRHVYSLLKHKDYRLWCFESTRLSGLPRFERCRGKVRDWVLDVPDAASFLAAYKEIFVTEIYRFDADSNAPKILDLGANIGLSVLYFKALYPNAQITAFEADPAIYECLKNNVYRNGFTDVELINKAVWDSNGKIRFRVEGGDGGRVVQDDDKHGMEIETIDISALIAGKSYDLLKMDIEGAEHKVLPAIKNYLHNFRFVFIEYHSEPDQPQTLGFMLNMLSSAGFRFDIQNIMTRRHPFISNRAINEFDLQLNIFAWNGRCEP